MKPLLTKYTDRIAPIAGIALAAAVAGFPLSAQAGIIVSESSASGAPGFGGWNLDNIEVELAGGGTYDELDGSYTGLPSASDNSYSAAVYDRADSDPDKQLMGLVLAKDWPVGEPSGIKVINGDTGVKPPKPLNCIMATSYLEEHFLDSPEPQPVTCSGPFQSHKRYKVAMLPTTVDTLGSESIDLVFNVEAEEGSRDYQIFQKINNWTGKRLQGFTVQVGFGIGEQFVPAHEGLETDEAKANLNISVPSDIWSPTQLATFSAGLFGPEDTHTGERGFFDPDTRAGFYIDEYVEDGEQSLTDTLTATTPLPSDYANVPSGAGDAAEQFGPWLPNIWLPQGIFFDDDGNPATDAALLAWYGYHPQSAMYTWMAGAATNFADIRATIEGEKWSNNLFYTMGEIDDLVNVGLNYVVTVGDVSTFPGSTFTIRVTPTADTSGAMAPGYVGVTPDPLLVFDSQDAAISLDPQPTFVVGSLLTARVGDMDLNINPELVDEVAVEIKTNGGLSQTLTLIEQGENRGVFAAALPENFSNVDAGTVVTLSYTDADNGSGNVEVKEQSTTAIADPVTVPSELSITSFSVADTLKNGQSRPVKLAIVNARDVAPANGEVRVYGTVDGVEVANFRGDINELKANGKLKFNWVWSAQLDNPEQAATVEWTADILAKDTAGNLQLVDQATRTTLIEVKTRKNAKN